MIDNSYRQKRSVGRRHAESGHSLVILAKLASIEAQIADMDRRMDLYKPRDLSAPVGEVCGFVYENM